MSMIPNQKAFLDMIAYSEIGHKLMAISDDGYNVIVGSTPTHPILFQDYADHPRRLIDLPTFGVKSTAAGRYQLLARYFDAYKTRLGLSDFSPASQDAIALQQIRECRALDDIEAGKLREAVKKCARIWASFPGNTYGQPTHRFESLQAAYLNAGGTVRGDAEIEAMDNYERIAMNDVPAL